MTKSCVDIQWIKGSSQEYEEFQITHATRVIKKLERPCVCTVYDLCMPQVPQAPQIFTFRSCNHKQVIFSIASKRITGHNFSNVRSIKNKLRFPGRKPQVRHQDQPCHRYLALTTFNGRHCTCISDWTVISISRRR